MEKSTKWLISLAVGCIIVLATILGALAGCPECNKGGWIQSDLDAAQAVASPPYYPIVFLMVVVGVAWLAKIAVEKYISKK